MIYYLKLLFAIIKKILYNLGFDSKFKENSEITLKILVYIKAESEYPCLKYALLLLLYYYFQFFMCILSQ
jgi:hypothetical protein